MESIIIYTDGGARGNPGPAGAGVYITDAKGKVLREVAKPLGNATNNYAEYDAVLTGLETLKQMFGKNTKGMRFEFRMDSELIQKQLNHEYQVKEPGLVPHFMAIHNLRVSSFPHVTFKHIRREQNREADRLANEAMDGGR
jgi:ribonuclease HI